MLLMSDETASGGKDLSIKLCSTSSNHCCLVPIGDTVSGQLYKKTDVCGYLISGMNTTFTVSAKFKSKPNNGRSKIKCLLIYSNKLSLNFLNK